MNESQPTCVVLAAGEYYDSTDGSLADLCRRGTGPHADGPMIIAADAGFDHAASLGLHVDMAVGDFDSIRAALPERQRAMRLPAQKDDSDTLAALKLGWRHGAREFHIFGALGGRIDHAIANIQLLAMLAQHGCVGYLYGDATVITAICDARLALAAGPGDEGLIVSVFSHSDRARDVNEHGLKYTLRHATLDNATVRGLSNELLGENASIDVHDGTLVITFPHQLAIPTVIPYRSHDRALEDVEHEVTSALTRRGALRDGLSGGPIPGRADDCER